MGGAPDSSLSPGFGGFLVFFVLALALWLLMRSMGGVLRRMQYRQEAEHQDQPQDAVRGDRGVPRSAERPVSPAVLDVPDGPDRTQDRPGSQR